MLRIQFFCVDKRRNVRYLFSSRQPHPSEVPMTAESSSRDAKSRKLALDMMGDGPERELAEAIDDTRTGKELMASLLGHQAIAAHKLAQRFYAMANAFMDSAGPGSASGNGERNAVLGMRLAGTAMRLTDRYRTATLAIAKLRDYEPHDCGPQIMTIDTGIPRKGPPGADRHWEKPGYRDDDDEGPNGTTPPANSNTG